MSEKVLTPEWMSEYVKHWNESPVTREGTKDLDMVVTYKLKEDEDRAGQYHIVAGEAVYGGPVVEGKKEDFVLTGKLKTWRELADGQLSPKSAIMLQHVKFRGSVKVAIGHLPALEEAMRIFGRIDTEWVV